MFLRGWGRWEERVAHAKAQRGAGISLKKLLGQDEFHKNHANSGLHPVNPVILSK